ncbi:MAG: M81 family metallopeptidase, partial [Pseudomonadota bacterium]
MRIAVGGLLHETNTFSDAHTVRADFERPTGWPMLSRGSSLVETLKPSGVPMGGALTVLVNAGVTIVPTLWAMALPAGPVEQPVFDELAGELIDGLAAAMPLDGVFLDLHGAMVCAMDDDPEGTLLARVRATIGHHVSLVAALDPHANLSAKMVEAADALFAYRTYPHTDMRQTGERAAKTLLGLAGGAPRAAKSYRAVPFHIPLVAQATGAEPMAGLMAAAEASTATVEICFGFPLADVPAAGPAIAVYAADAEAAEREADAQLSRWLAAEDAFAVAMVPPDQAAQDAIRESASEGAGPVILADVQDNPGAGGSNDTTGLLSALVAAKAEGTVLAHIVDQPAVDAAHAAGVCGTID